MNSNGGARTPWRWNSNRDYDIGSGKPPLPQSIRKGHSGNRVTLQRLA